jgi:hypothetical protein
MICPLLARLPKHAHCQDVEGLWPLEAIDDA